MRLVFVAFACALSVHAQSFEVATVRPSGPQDRIIGLFTYPGGRISATLYTLQQYIEEAFDVQSFQVSGGPSWIREDRYNIVAKPPSSSQSSKSNPNNPKLPMNEEQRRMLQSLLAERFHLKFHREDREVSAYLLSKSRKDLKLSPAKSADDYPWVGSLVGGGISGDGIAGTNATMDLLAARLSRAMRRPVVNQTAIEGSFDFRSPYTPDAGGADVVSSILASLQGLGLELKSGKAPVSNIVIDYAEKPSEN